MTSYDLSMVNGYLNKTTQTTLSGPRHLRLRKGDRPDENNPPGDSVAVTWHKDNLNGMQTMNDTFNRVASGIRVTDTALNSIEKNVDQMHDQLKTHIKNFPPFLPGSEERVKFLKSFNTFRKQIDSMTFPPNSDDAMKLMADPSVVPEAGDWEIVVGENGLQKTISSKEVHTGPTGLDIPELPENADDTTLETAIAGMEKSKAILKQRKSELSRDISEMAGFKTQATGIRGLPASAAEPVSINIRHGLAGITGIGLTEVPSQLTCLLDN